MRKSRYFQMYAQPSLIASGPQMAAWGLQFTSFPLTQGQLAWGSENSVGSSMQLLRNTHTQQHAKDENFLKGARGLTQTRPRVTPLHEVHSSCFSALAISQKNRRTSFYSTEGSPYVCKCRRKMQAQLQPKKHSPL